MDNLKTFISIIFLVLFGLLGAVSAWQITSWNKDKQIAIWQTRFDEKASAVQMLSDHNVAYAQAYARTMTKDDFKALLSDQYKLFKNDLKLQQIDHYTDLQTITTNHVNTILRDSLTFDTVKVKAFRYITPNLQIKGYTDSDSLHLTYKHYLQLQIAAGKEARKGFWNKITLQPFRRTPVVKAVASDTNTIITHIQSIKIK